jgi:hypothetical protein
MVWVTPAPEANRSLVIVEVAVTVVLRLYDKPVLLANSSVPPPSETALVPKADALVVARSEPALTVVVPE